MDQSEVKRQAPNHKFRAISENKLVGDFYTKVIAMGAAQQEFDKGSQCVAVYNSRGTRVFFRERRLA